MTTIINPTIEQIARQYLFLETLEVRGNDNLDFHDVGVVGLQSALQAAYGAGFKAAQASDSERIAQRSESKT